MSDLAKGRGVPEEFADIIVEIANLLNMNGVLIRKPGKPKVALNPERRAEIGRIVGGVFPNDRLREILMEDRDSVSARILDRSSPQPDGSEQSSEPA